MARALDAKRASRRKVERRFLQGAAFGLFALGNPLYLVGCSGTDSGSGDDQYEYGQQDMVEVASGLAAAGPYEVGEYSITVQFPFGGESAALETGSRRLEPGFFSRAHACGTRSFVAPAAACIDSSEMQLAATLRVERGTEAVLVDVTGYMRVMSRILTSADFEFAAPSLRLSFGWREAEGYRPLPSGTGDTAQLDALFAR